MLGRMFSPLRHIDADPDQLVREAHAYLREADDTRVWEAKTALASVAVARIQLAQYLKEHHH